MPRPDDPVQFPDALCPECAFLVFQLLEALGRAQWLVATAHAENEFVDWTEVRDTLTIAMTLTDELQIHHRALDHDTPNDDEEE